MKYKRIKKNTQFTKLFGKGKRVFSPCLTVLYLPAKEISMGIAVSKKHGKAHIRNRIKRLLREAFRLNADKLEGTYDLVLIPKVAKEYSLKEFEKSLDICINKVNSCRA